MWLALLVWAATAVTDTIGHAKGQGLAPNDYWRRARLLVSRELLSAVPIAGAFAWCGSWLLGAVALGLGVSIWPAYHLGNRLPLNVPVPLAPSVQGPPAGEWLYGFSRALFAVAAAV